MPVLFAFTLFVSAALLFMVQPMIGRLVLPLVGGSPGAWNTCMVFFQTLLLLGYLYAHAVTTKLTPRKQLAVHAGVMGIAIAAMALSVAIGPLKTPISIVPSLAPQGTAYPMFGMLALLAVSIGIPFFVVSTSAPLLQKWFTYTGHPSARDPYFLYAASNAGSLISLLGYPLFIEPTLSIPGQEWVWAVGFCLLFALAVYCGMQAKAGLPVPKPTKAVTPSGPISRWRVVKWILLGFVPSSLMLGVTFYMTTDITSMPLLWVPPLALYLLTFIIAFARLPNWFRPLIGNVAPVGILLLAFVLNSGLSLNDNENAFLWLALHNAVFFLTALMCHTELAFDRPGPDHLTGYLLAMSFGGMLGGVFNGLIAPVIFKNSFEYPFALAVGAMLIPKFTAETKTQEQSAVAGLFDLLVPAAMLAFVAGMTKLYDFQTFSEFAHWCSRQISSLMNAVNLQADIKAHTMAMLIIYAIPAMIAFFFIDRPLRFGLCVAAILLVGCIRMERSSTIESTRSFFGILKVMEAENDDVKTVDQPSLLIFIDKAKSEEIGRIYYEREYYLRLVHGTTLHGTQASTTWTFPIRDDVKMLGSVSPWSALLTSGAYAGFDMRQEPLTYYHRTGPVGSLMREAFRRDPNLHIGMVGLGSGSVACYAQPGQKLTYYEIDPAVIDIVDRPKSSDPDKARKQFTYLADARKRGAQIDFVLGDARLKLAEQTDRKYPLLLIDAFSSDAIPVHLLTKEAVELYINRLTPGGLLGLHISNKYIVLEPVVARIAQELGLVGLVFNDGEKGYSGKTGSQWIVLAKSEADLGELNLWRMERFDPETNTQPPMMAALGGAGWQSFNKPSWQPISPLEGVTLWTDDYADVLRVMKLKEVQRVRAFFGLPTPVKE